MVSWNAFRFAEALYWVVGISGLPNPPADGHAPLVRASDEVRRNVDVFYPQPGGLAALGERVRQSFDPKTSSIAVG